MNKIIAFAGKMRSGKGVAAHCLEERYGYTYIEVADKLKEICVELTGLSDINELNEYKNNGKTIDLMFNFEVCNKLAELAEIPSDFVLKKMYGKHIVNVRVLLQILGTDVLRAYNKDWHVYHMVDKILSLRKQNKSVVIGDVRFPNEKLIIEGMGGEVYYVEMKNYDIFCQHPSEYSLFANDFDVDHIIYNVLSTDGNIDHFINKVIDKLNKQTDTK